jgi:hypothetical protein
MSQTCLPEVGRLTFDAVGDLEMIPLAGFSQTYSSSEEYLVAWAWLMKRRVNDPIWLLNNATLLDSEFALFPDEFWAKLPTIRKNLPYIEHGFPIAAIRPNFILQHTLWDDEYNFLGIVDWHDVRSQPFELSCSANAVQDELNGTLRVSEEYLEVLKEVEWNVMRSDRVSDAVVAYPGEMGIVMGIFERGIEDRAFRRILLKIKEGIY